MKSITVNQRTPSKWMLLSIAQSIIYLFGVPILCRKYWDTLFGSLSNDVAAWLLTTATPIIFYFAFTIAMLPIYWMQHPFFEQFKIQNNQTWPWLDESKRVRRDFWTLSFRSVKLTTVNFLILLPILAAAQIWLSKITGTEDPSAFMTDDDHWPTLTKNFQDIFSLCILHEFGFYMTHKMMHVYPSLYKYHKIHHEYKMNTTLASQHSHPIDFVLSLGGPALVAVSIVKPHSSTLFQFTLWIMWANLDDHVGYSFPWSPIRWFPLSAATDEHEFHHSKNMGCYGSKLSIFNSLFGRSKQYCKYKGKQEGKSI